MFQDLLNLFYPNICFCCERPLSKNEQIICVSCRHNLPLLQNFSEKPNSTEKIFYGRVEIENAASLLLFEKRGPVQNLIHHLKYRGNEEIGIYLGKWMGEALAKTPEFMEVEVVVPVPLHKKKLKTRGYNQVEKFGREIANALKAHYEDAVLIKKTSSKSQTYKRRFSRWGKIEESFALQDREKLIERHVLLVDDLVTTGATLEACALKLKEIPGVKISIATMALAD